SCLKCIINNVEQLTKAMPNSHCLSQVTGSANSKVHFKWTGIYL
ncbi:Os05g0591500, partial [Oryza sativa Japonica Group]